MHHLNESLSRELIALAKRDLSVRDELVADGSLGTHGYHPRMEAVHQDNAAHLAAIIERYGWPGKNLVGEEGAWAAWLIAQHAIGNPPFMRHCLSLLKEAAARNEALPWQVAMLEDRIRSTKGNLRFTELSFSQITVVHFIPTRSSIPNPSMKEGLRLD